MKIRKEERTLYLIPETDLVASRIEELRDFFNEQIKAHTDVSLVSLDVSHVDFVDSLGVNLIIGLYRQVVDSSRHLEIIGAGRTFMKVASFFRLPSIFPVKSKEVEVERN